MGRGPFFDRPFTAGDEGWFGLDRPLVGAANGVIFTVDADSVRDIAAEETLPRQVQNKIDELADTRQEMRNTKEKIQKLSPVSGDVFTSIADAVNLGFIREGTPLERQVDKLRRLKRQEIKLMIAIESADALDPKREGEVVSDIVDVGGLSPDRKVNPPTVEPGFEIDELADTFETVLNRQMRDLPISTGPVVDGSGDKLTVVMTMVNMDKRDVGKAKDRIERLGAQVESQEFFQT